MKIYHTKVFLHENFQIYGMLHILVNVCVFYRRYNVMHEFGPCIDHEKMVGSCDTLCFCEFTAVHVPTLVVPGRSISVAKTPDKAPLYGTDGVMSV